MKPDFPTSLVWPVEKANELILLAAKKSRLKPVGDILEHPPAGIFYDNPDDFNDWFIRNSNRAGLLAEPTLLAYRQAVDFLHSRRNVVLTVQRGDEPSGLLFMLSAKGKRAILLGPTGKTRSIPIDDLRSLLWITYENKVDPMVTSLVEEMDLSAAAKNRVGLKIRDEILGPVDRSGIWTVRPADHQKFSTLVRFSALPGLVLAMTGIITIEMIMLFGSWWLIGVGALQGRLDWGLVLAWALMVFTLVPLRLLFVNVQHRISIELGGLFRRRLLYGILRLEPDSVKTKGIGQFLGLVMDFETIETLSILGGLLTVVTCFEILFGIMLMTQGVGALFLTTLAAFWLVITVLILIVLYRNLHEWTDIRLSMTNSLVEKMVGHRTRTIQLDRNHIHDDDDERLADYLRLSRRADRATSWLMILLPRGWLVLGIAGLLPSLAFSSSPQITAVAISLGGIIMMYRGLMRFTGSALSILRAALSFTNIKPLLVAAKVPETLGYSSADTIIGQNVNSDGQQPLLLAHELQFRYRQKNRQVLENASLAIHRHDRILVEGPSGCGKSTLLALLTGLRQPESGLLLLHGLDQHTVGDSLWRSRIATTPQFHENHVLTGTLAFNLLMGRRWPPTGQDLLEAETICRELGLGELLQRMPSGMMQIVGDTGWQLSHGEKSRLYIARSLLQNADIIMLDESFAALDPMTFRTALACVKKRAPALFIIAHP